MDIVVLSVDTSTGSFLCEIAGRHLRFFPPYEATDAFPDRPPEGPTDPLAVLDNVDDDFRRYCQSRDRAELSFEWHHWTEAIRPNGTDFPARVLVSRALDQWQGELRNPLRAIRLMRAFRVIEGCGDRPLTAMRDLLSDRIGAPPPDIQRLWTLPALPLSSSPQTLMRFTYRHLVVRGEWHLAYTLLYTLLAQLGHDRAGDDAWTLFAWVAEELGITQVIDQMTPMPTP